MKRSLDALSLDLEPADARPTSSAPPSRGGIVVDLFRKHAARVRRSLSFRLRNPDDAQDAAQEVFLKLWRQEREGNLREEATAYLNSAANSTATDFERWRTFHVLDRLADVELEEIPAGTSSSEERQHWRDAMALFVEAVEMLPERTRDVFLLHQMKGLTYPEIALRLNVNVRTVERHIVQAFSILQHRLREYL